MSAGLCPATVSVERAIQLLTSEDGRHLAVRHLAALSSMARQYEAHGFPLSDASKLATLLHITRQTIQRGRQVFVDPCCSILR
jgi:hypothetical protein